MSRPDPTLGEAPGNPRWKRPSSRRWASWVVAACVCAQPAWAESPRSQHSQHPKHDETVAALTFSRALREGAKLGPDVIVAAAPRRATADAVEHANPLLTQVPVLQAQVGPRFSGSELGPDVLVAVSQPIPLINTGRAQEGLARAERRAVERNVERAALDAAERAGQAWITLAHADALLKLRKSAVEESAANLKVVESRVQAGAADVVELSLAQSELAAAQAQVLDAEGRHFDASADLAYWAGLPEGRRAEVQGTLDDLPRWRERPDATADHHPAVQSAEAQAEASKQAIEYAKSQQVPSLSVGVQYQREGTGDQIVSGVLSVPIALWQPWRFQEARQRAHFDVARAQASVVRRELTMMLERARHERSHAAGYLDLLEKRALPPREEAVRVAQVKFQAGEYDFPRLIWARRELLAVRERVADALARLRGAELHLTRCTGELEERIQ